jgi:hypothetical protein
MVSTPENIHTCDGNLQRVAMAGFFDESDMLMALEVGIKFSVSKSATPIMQNCGPICVD